MQPLALTCEKCQQSYDLTGYGIDTQFPCSCGEQLYHPLHPEHPARRMGLGGLPPLHAGAGLPGLPPLDGKLPAGLPPLDGGLSSLSKHPSLSQMAPFPMLNPPAGAAQASSIQLGSFEDSPFEPQATTAQPGFTMTMEELHQLQSGTHVPPAQDPMSYDDSMEMIESMGSLDAIPSMASLDALASVPPQDANVAQKQEESKSSKNPVPSSQTPQTPQTPQESDEDAQFATSAPTQFDATPLPPPPKATVALTPLRSKPPVEKFEAQPIPIPLPDIPSSSSPSLPTALTSEVDVENVEAPLVTSNEMTLFAPSQRPLAKDLKISRSSDELPVSKPSTLDFDRERDLDFPRETEPKNETPAVDWSMEFKQRDIQIDQTHKEIKQLQTDWKVLQKDMRESIVLVQQQWSQIQEESAKIHEERTQSQEETTALLEKTKTLHDKVMRRISQLEEEQDRLIADLVEAAMSAWEEVHVHKMEKMQSHIEALEARLAALEAK